MEQNVDKIGLSSGLAPFKIIFKLFACEQQIFFKLDLSALLVNMCYPLAIAIRMRNLGRVICNLHVILIKRKRY